MASPLPLSPNTETVLLFGSQALSFDQPSFRKLSSTVLSSPNHNWALRIVEELPEQLDLLCKKFPKLSAAAGASHLPELGNWIKDGTLGAHHLPNVLLSPLVVMSQLTQYTTYVSLREPEALPASEAVGFCTGLLSALVVSSSATKREFEKNAAAAVRLAMLTGAVVDAQDALDESGPSTTFTVASKTRDVEKEVAKVIDPFADAYVSVVYDENRVSITTSRRSAAALERELKLAGFTVAEIGLCGRFHSQKHGSSIDEILQFCSANSDFSLPDASSVRTPVRSNSKGGFANSGALHEVALRAILLERAEWYNTLAEVTSSRLASKDAKMVCFGPERCVPPSLLRSLSTQVLHFEDVALPQRSPNEVAVVGLSINVAGADDAGEFWQLLAEGKSQHMPVPRDRFGFDTVFRENDAKKTWYGNFVSHHDTFDHKFFKKTPRESASMDPQQRLLMQVAYQAVEQSGYFESAREERSIGCFVGVCGTDYAENVACHPPNAFTATGNLRGFIAGKISHYFGWTGPGLTVDTACSGSAVAVHQACRAILSGDCIAALAGGTNIMTHPLLFQNLAGASFLSPTGQCKPFDALADGYCRGEAVAAVFLKDMSAAVADGDQILGVVSSTAVQQNENCTPIVVPNAPSLSDLFRTVVRRSGLEPSQVSVVEAHGTGTPVGDPAEYESIRSVFGGHTRSKPLQLGSVKGLVGHTEGSSGVVSLAKILLMMQEGRIPPQASFSKMNPSIHATPEDKMQISTQLQPWDADFKAALINNYGASGSNASMVVTQAPKPAKSIGSSAAPVGLKYPFWLCGSDDRSIRAYAARLRRFRKTKTDSSIADLSFNMARQSNRHLERAAIFTAASTEELDEKLAALESAGGVSLPPSRPVVLCFGGQINTSVGLDRQVYDNVAILRRHLDTCDAVARSLGAGSIYPHVFQKEPLQDIVSLQTALFSLQYSAARSWIGCGVKPVAVVGHSFGEISALCISGVLSLRDAMKAVVRRATIIRDAWGPEKGSMLAVEADADAVAALINESGTPATIACFNGPTSHTVAGSVATVDAVVETIKSKFPATRFKRLNVSNAYHSTLVDELKPQLAKIGEGLTFNEATIPLERATEERSTASFSEDFFAEHLRNPVYFNHAIQRIAREHPSAIWLEAGSNATVTHMASKALEAPSSHHFQAVNISSTQCLQKLVDTTISLWKAGLRVAFWGHSRHQTHEYAHILLPPYQFDRQRHWLELKEPPRPTAVTSGGGLWTFVGYQDSQQRAARFRVNTAAAEYEKLVAGHKIAGAAPICPATVQIDLAIEALHSLHAGAAPLSHVRNVANLVPVCVDPTRAVWLDLEALDPARLTWAWKMASTGASGAAPTTHVTGELVLRGGEQSEFARCEQSVTHQGCLRLLDDDGADEVMQGRSIYRVFAEIVDYGEQYRGLQKLVAKGDASAGRVVKKHSGRSWLDAFLADAFCQVGGIWANCMTDRDPADMYIANGIRQWVRSPRGLPAADEWHVLAQHARAPDGSSFLTDIFVFDAKSGGLAEVVLGINYARVSKASMGKLLTRLTAAADTATHANPPAGPIAPSAPAVRAEPVAAPSAPPRAAATVKELKLILADISGLEPEEIKDDTELADIGVDSLMGMEMAREIETAFKCTLPQEQLMAITDLPGLLACLNAALGAPAGGGGGGDDDGGSSESAHDSGYISPASDGAPGRKTPDSATANEEPASHGVATKQAALPVRRSSNVDKNNSSSTEPVRDESDFRFRISPADVYESMRRVGIQHGPIFQNLKAVRARDAGSLATLEVVDTAATMPYQHEQPHVVHPTTLDSVFQAVYAALPDAGASMTSAQVPRSIKELWIAGDMARTAPGDRFRAFSSVRDADKEGFRAGVTVTREAAEEPVVRIDDFFFQSIGSALGARDPCENDKFLTARWVPDPTLTAPALLQKHLAAEPDAAEAQALADLKRVSSWFIQDALAALSPAEARALEGHFKRYYAWMQQHAAAAAAAAATTSPQEKAALAAKVAARSINGELVCSLGPRLADVLRGLVSPLALMQEDQRLYRFYAEGLKLDRSRSQLAELVRLHAHKKPRARILEIGAGSGGATRHALRALGVEDPLAAAYDFTDVSEAFFDAAEEDLQDWKGLLAFKKLDIEQDPAAQGFEPESYDLVLASQVLHKTTSVAAAVSNVRKLLKPGGTLLLMEPTKEQLDVQLALGLLPDQWLGTEEARRTSPLLSVEQWDTELRRGGFGGVELHVRDCESDDLYTYSVMASSAETPASAYQPEVVVATPKTAPPQPWLDMLSSSISAITGAVPAVQPYDSVDCEGKMVIFVGELSSSVLASPDDAQFEALRTLCTTSKGLLWVTRGGAVDVSDPLASLAQGFTRILRLEYVGKRIGTLDLDPSRDAWSAPSVDAIASVVSELFADLSAPASEPRDYEFAERGGAVNILRYFKDHTRNSTWFPNPTETTHAVPQPFASPDAPLRLTVERPGQLDSLVFGPAGPRSEQSLAEDELEIAPRAFGISSRDVSVATGALQDRRMGFECAGLVVRASAATGFKPGDRVAALLHGDGIASRVRVPWTSAVRVPDDMGFEMAAALPVAYATAWVALMDAARLAEGESVLVHDAAGAVGQAAVALAKHAGADVFVTVASPDQTSFVRGVLGVPQDRIFPADDRLAAGVLARTGGRGVDVVLNTLEGALLRESLDCVAPLGRFVELGKKDVEQSSRLDMAAFARGVSFSTVDLVMLAERKGQQVSRALHTVFDLVKTRKIRGVPVSRHDISDVVQAFRNASSGKTPGKTVLSVKPDSLVPTIPHAPVAKLRPDASYVVVGGFGGIGQSICFWLAEHGARNLIVLSRSASSADKAAPLLAELRKLGCEVKPIGCDIADEADVKRAIASCADDMPPVRGVIQGAMVLRDSILEQMSLSDYTAGLRPKVQGTWNLHTTFASTPLDFFVILSSVAGVIGIASQCNYGAGGSFQDALAQYRISQGLPAVSIDIGAVKNVGYVAEHEDTNAYLKKQGHMILSEGDVLKALECAVTDPYAGQLIFGINTSPSSAFWDEGGPAARDLRFWPAKFRSGAGDGGDTDDQADNLARRIARAKTMEEAAGAVAAEVTAKLMDIFMIPEAEVFPNKSMAEFGVDSLTAVELRNALALKAGAEVSIFDIMQAASLTALATTIAGKSSHISPALASAVAAA